MPARGLASAGIGCQMFLAFFQISDPIGALAGVKSIDAKNPKRSFIPDKQDDASRVGGPKAVDIIQRFQFVTPWTTQFS